MVALDATVSVFPREMGSTCEKCNDKAMANQVLKVPG